MGAVNEWEYRVKAFAPTGEDEEDSRKLTNIALPAQHERGRVDGWEIFAVVPDESGVYLLMKRPKRGIS